MSQIVLLGAVLLLALGPAIAYWIQRQSESIEEVMLELPSGASGWTGPSLTQDAWTPFFNGASTVKSAYEKDGHEVFVYAGYYPVQSQGRELISDSNLISGQKSWRMTDQQEVSATIDDLLVLEQGLNESSGNRRLVWYWYHVAGVRAINKYEVKALQVLGWLIGKPQASVTAVATDYVDDAEAARTVLREFISAMGGPLAKVAVKDAQQR